MLSEHAGSSCGIRSPRDLHELYMQGQLRVGECLDPLIESALSGPAARLGFARVTAEAAHVAVDAGEKAFARARATGSGVPALTGVPVSIKDLFDTAGVRTAYGSRAFDEHVPDADAAVVARIRELGAVPVGKTITHEFAWGITCISGVDGGCRNPWDPSRIAGGSSGGAAVSIATRACSVALGTDTAGSVRIPAAFCGVTGFKPTSEILSTAGVFPLAPTFDHVGLLADRPADVWDALSALLGTRVDALGHTTLDGQKIVEGLVVGVMMPTWAPELSEPVAAGLRRAVSLLEHLGAHCVPVEVPEGGSLLPAFATVQSSEALAIHRQRGLFPAGASSYEPDVRARFEAATEIQPSQLRNAKAQVQRYGRALRAALDTVDVALSPVAACLPPLVNDVADLRDLTLPFTIGQNVAGVPACTARVGAEGRLPVAVQVFARRHADRLVLSVAGVLVDALAAGHRGPP